MWDERELLRLHYKLRQLLSRKGIGADQVDAAFREHDNDGIDGLSQQEMGSFLEDVLPDGLDSSEVAMLWRSLDPNGLGQVRASPACMPVCD